MVRGCRVFRRLLDSLERGDSRDFGTFEAAPKVFPALLVQFSVDEQPPGGLTCTPWP